MAELHRLEGMQFFKKIAAKSIIPKKLRKDFCVVKERRPKWYTRSMAWKQTYSIQKKSKVGRKCS